MRGFSLIELLIVVAITAIIGSIAIPSLVASRAPIDRATVKRVLRSDLIYSEVHYGRALHFAFDGSTCESRTQVKDLSGEFLECDWKTAEAAR